MTLAGGLRRGAVVQLARPQSCRSAFREISPAVPGTEPVRGNLQAAADTLG
jgi:hypothetical protein